MIGEHRPTSIAIEAGGAYNKHAKILRSPTGV
jgi:hypothetical protein